MLLDRQQPILVTGSAGRLGRAAVSALGEAGWRVRGFDRAPTPGAVESIVGSLTDAAALNQAAVGVCAVIHLAATPDDDDFATQLLPNNIVGLYHTLEAARLGGAKRVLLASSGQVNWWQQIEGPWPLRVNDPITPREWYAVTKVAAEAAGMTYSKNFGMAVLALRLGWCPRTREQVAEIEALPRGQDVFLSPADAGRFFVRAMEAALEPGFSILYVASQPAHRELFDLEPTEKLLGWTPQDRWPAGAMGDLNV